MRGVTLPVFRFYKHNASLNCADLRQLSDVDVSGIYRQLYWNPVHGDELPAGVDLSIMDMAVNSGVSASVRLLQGVIGTNLDGVLGAHTLAILVKLDPMQIIDKLTTAQGAYYRSLAAFPIFGEGWLNRLARRETAALKCACEVNAPTPQMMLISLRRQMAPPVHPAAMPWGSMAHLAGFAG